MKASNKLVIGLDIGGTKLAGGVLDSNAVLLERRERPARVREGVQVSLGQVFDMAVELHEIAAARHGRVAGIGVCAPGPLDPRAGVIFNPPNMPGWRDIPLAAELARRSGLPCRVENDANGAGLAEALYGAGRGHSSVFYVTLSTGIGTGIILDRRVYHGKNGFAGEGGHVTIDYRSKVVCNCGAPGCIEALASGTAIARRARHLLGKRADPGLTAETLARAAAQGDRLARRLIEETAQMLGAWLGGVISLLDPDIIVIGGGVSRIGDPLFSRIQEAVLGHTINPNAADTPIVPAALEHDVGLRGTAAVILSHLASDRP